MLCPQETVFREQCEGLLEESEGEEEEEEEQKEEAVGGAQPSDPPRPPLRPGKITGCPVNILQSLRPAPRGRHTR